MPPLQLVLKIEAPVTPFALDPATVPCDAPMLPDTEGDRDVPSPDDDPKLRALGELDEAREAGPEALNPVQEDDVDDVDLVQGVDADDVEDFVQDVNGDEDVWNLVQDVDPGVPHVMQEGTTSDAPVLLNDDVNVPVELYVFDVFEHDVDPEDPHVLQDGTLCRLLDDDWDVFDMPDVFDVFGIVDTLEVEGVLVVPVLEADVLEATDVSEVLDTEVLGIDVLEATDVADALETDVLEVVVVGAVEAQAELAEVTQEQRLPVAAPTCSATINPQPERTQAWAFEPICIVELHWQAKSVTPQPAPDAAL